MCVKTVARMVWSTFSRPNWQFLVSYFLRGGRGVTTFARMFSALFSTFWKCQTTDEKNRILKKKLHGAVTGGGGLKLYGKGSYEIKTFQKGTSLNIKCTDT